MGDEELCPHGHRYEDCCWQGSAPRLPKHGEPGHQWNETACAWCNWQARTAVRILLEAFEHVVLVFQMDKKGANMDAKRAFELLRNAVDNESAIVELTKRTQTPEGTPIPTQAHRDLIKAWVDEARAFLGGHVEGSE